MLLRRLARLEEDRVAAGPSVLVPMRWGEDPTEAVERHVAAWSREHGHVAVPSTWAALVVGEPVSVDEWTRRAAQVAEAQERERVEAEHRAEEVDAATRAAEHERARAEQARVVAEQEIDREIAELQREGRVYR